MALASLVLDASVAIKWFSATGETDVSQALDILDSHVRGKLVVVVPDLLYYEVANAHAYKAALPSDKLRLCVKSLFDLELQTVAVNRELIDDSASISRRSGISVYDACYCAAARRSNMPLVTANPRHQGRSAACQIISLDEWGRQGSDLHANSPDAWR